MNDFCSIRPAAAIVVNAKQVKSASNKLDLDNIWSSHFSNHRPASRRHISQLLNCENVPDRSQVTRCLFLNCCDLA